MKISWYGIGYIMGFTILFVSIVLVYSYALDQEDKERPQDIEFEIGTETLSPFIYVQTEEAKITIRCSDHNWDWNWDYIEDKVYNIQVRSYELCKEVFPELFQNLIDDKEV